jgi:hypothetical protein
MIFFWVQIALMVWDVVDMVGTFNRTKAQAIDTELQSNHMLTHDQIVANATNTAVIEDAVAAVCLLLSTFVVFKVKAGRSWARSLVTLASILFLIVVLPMEIATGSIKFASVPALVVNIVTFTTTVLLYLPSSSAYFTAVRRHPTRRHPTTGSSTTRP